MDLPIDVRIVTHYAERDRGNTGVHAALLAPRHAQQVPFDQVTNEDTAGAAVLFPADDAEPVSKLALSEVKCLYIIDRCAASIHQWHWCMCNLCGTTQLVVYALRPPMAPAPTTAQKW